MDKEKMIALMGAIMLGLLMILFVALGAYHTASIRAASCEARLDVIMSGDGR